MKTDRILSSSLIFLSLFLQVWRFGPYVMVKTIIGSIMAFIVVAAICLNGRRINPKDCRGCAIRYFIGYTSFSGAKGRPRQLFGLFVAYFSIGGILNLPLIFDSTVFFLTICLIVTGLTGITLPWVKRKCEGG
jgi:hypothetical protein